ncbi:competence/damage-inducible protein A [Lysinibacillus fusiformis]|uniref:competence/damage-inducible protein A n=1 Tax=Lysinibacillus fusiformis TaxID=28031 RepID=UPI001CDA5031|nr:molybdopterin-binding protein [Lysinibacillus fusiformis]
MRCGATLRRTFASGDIVFSTGGSGATPDDHTRQCAAAALGVPLELHPEAAKLIQERIRDMYQPKDGSPLDLDSPENRHRLNMGTYPQGAAIIPNGYNKIPGFSIRHHHFVPGFPVMAWPMIEWVLDTYYVHLHHTTPHAEKSLLVFELPESRVTPLMEKIERDFPGVRVFSLPSVGDAERGGVYARHHIDLGVKGEPEAVAAAFVKLREGVHLLGGDIVEPEAAAAAAAAGKPRS